MRISDWSSDVCSSDLPSSTVSYVKIPCPNEINHSTLLGMPIVAKWLEDGEWYHGRISSFRTESFEVEWHYEPGCLRSTKPHLNLQIGRASCRERVCPSV